MSDLCTDPYGDCCTAYDESGHCKALIDTDFQDRPCPFFCNAYMRSKTDIEIEIQEYAKSKGECISATF